MSDTAPTSESAATDTRTRTAAKIDTKQLSGHITLIQKWIGMVQTFCHATADPEVGHYAPKAEKKTIAKVSLIQVEGSDDEESSHNSYSTPNRQLGQWAKDRGMAHAFHAHVLQARA
eukprot:jgi/Phyca11/15198/fgenesh1_pg.PHYCAscaffold_12_\